MVMFHSWFTELKHGCAKAICLDMFFIYMVILSLHGEFRCKCIVSRYILDEQCYFIATWNNVSGNAVFLDMFNMSILILSLYGQYKWCIHRSILPCLSQYYCVYGYVLCNGSSHFQVVTIHTWFTELIHFMAY